MGGRQGNTKGHILYASTCVTFLEMTKIWSGGHIRDFRGLGMVSRGGKCDYRGLESGDLCGDGIAVS